MDSLDRAVYLFISQLMPLVITHHTYHQTFYDSCWDIEGHYRNHSLCQTAATYFFEAGVDEQLIMLPVGHSGVRSYKHVSEQLKKCNLGHLEWSLNHKDKF